MADIAYILPLVGLSEGEAERRETVANDLVADDISVVGVDAGPLSIETAIEEEWAGVAVCRLLPAIEDDFDALVIGCFGDPGLSAARELTRTPVVGPAMASFHTAAQVADQFSTLTILDGTEPSAHRLLNEYGVSDRVASVRVVDTPVLDIDHDADEVVERMLSVGKAAVEEDGAGALVPGCMSLAFMQVHDRIADEVGVPFIDPVTAALETAGSWARHGISHSAASYPLAPRDKLDGLFGRKASSATD